MRMNEHPLKPMQKFLDPSLPMENKQQKENIISPVIINYSQRETVTKTNNEIMLCQGPPGTGKTQTIVNIIANEILKGHTVLVASTNNKAVDNIKEKITSDTNLFSGVLRLGNKETRNKALKEVEVTLNTLNTFSDIDSKKKKNYC